jgi:uncharacterized membrane protein YhiD involved in acid resistance
MKKIKLPQIKIPKVYIFGIDIIKNFLFFTLYIIITLLAIAFLIAPAVKTFKKDQKAYFQTKNEYNQVLQTYNQNLDELNKLKKKNSKILNALKRDFNINNFKAFASQYMNVKEIKEVNQTTYKKDFIKTTYIATTSIKSPKNFYDFIDALKKYKYVLRVYFPINFQKDSKSENISLTLKIEHFKLKHDK